MVCIFFVAVVVVRDSVFEFDCFRADPRIMFGRLWLLFDDSTWMDVLWVACSLPFIEVYFDSRRVLVALCGFLFFCFLFENTGRLRSPGCRSLGGGLLYLHYPMVMQSFA